MTLLRLLCFFALLTSGSVCAVDLVNGKAKYDTFCIDCHGAPPDKDAKKAANDAALLTRSLTSVSSMTYLKPLLSTTDISDIAAYIGSVTVGATPAPRLATSPTTLTFAPQVVGTTSNNLSIAVSNSGTAAATALQVSVSYAAFKVASNSCGTSLFAGGICSIAVNVTPTVSGGVTGNLTLNANGLASPIVVALSGTGTAAATPPTLSLSPSTLAFGNQLALTASANQTLSLANTGTVAVSGLTLTPSASATTAGFVISARTCGATLAVGASCQFTVSFTPATTGLQTGAIAVNATGLTTPLTLSLTGTGFLLVEPATDIVVEYYSASLDRFFSTASQAERVFVDSGGAGDWKRTGNAFKSGGKVQVCRFYGNTATNPATGAPYGPNSHFFTAITGECDFTKTLFKADAVSWKFESLDFNTEVPVSGTCPANTVPVYRAYNNGFPAKPSNHRFTTNRVAILEVVAKGWVDEAIVMCAPP